MSTPQRPLIGVTMGDPAGIGPEITLRAVAQPEVQAVCRPVVVGDAHVLELARRACDLDLEFRIIVDPSEGDYSPGILNLIDLANVDRERFAFGQISAMAGRASVDYVEKAVALVNAGKVSGIATGPIHKEAIKAAGVPHIGHTELLADLTNSPDTMTMFSTGPLRIFFLSRHVSLREACDLVTHDRVLKTLGKSVRALRQLGIQDPTIAVAGLNPHSGDGGLMGMEEIREIIPAIEAAQREGIKAVGPIGADSVFQQGYAGRFDAVLSLYHDQGHIGSKCIDFHHTTSVTLGLPFIRASVDHGTAMDIAGKGIANATSMAESILVAARYISLASGGVAL